MLIWLVASIPISFILAINSLFATPEQRSIIAVTEKGFAEKLKTLAEENIEEFDTRD